MKAEEELAMLSAKQPKVLLDGLVLPEGLRWHDGRLWFSDIVARKVISVDLEGRSKVVAEFDDDEPSGLGFLPDGTPLVAMMWKRRLLRLEKGGPAVHADFKSLPGGWINDMVVDSSGRAYVGNGHPATIGVTSPFQPQPVHPDPLGDTVIVFPPGGPPRTAARDVRGPNGMVLTPDGRTLILAESPIHRLTAFTVDGDGSLTGRRVHADSANFHPDGLALDAEGAIWTSAPGGKFARVLPGGKVAETITIEGKRTPACALGGPDRRTLFMATWIVDGQGAEALRIPGKVRGFIEVATVDVPGAGLP
jgi:sugar lactone lactonase YvrE